MSRASQVKYSKDTTANQVLTHIAQGDFKAVAEIFQKMLDREFSKSGIIVKKSPKKLPANPPLDGSPKSTPSAASAHARSPSMSLLHGAQLVKASEASAIVRLFKNVRGSISGPVQDSKIAPIEVLPSSPDARKAVFAKFYKQLSQMIGAENYKIYIGEDHKTPINRRRLTVQCYLSSCIELALNLQQQFENLLARLEQKKNKHEFFNTRPRILIYIRRIFYRRFTQYFADIRAEANEAGEQLGVGAWNSKAILMLEEIRIQFFTHLIKPNLEAPLSDLDLDTLKDAIEGCFKVEPELRQWHADRFSFSHLSIRKIPDELLNVKVEITTEFTRVHQGWVGVTGSIITPTVFEIVVSLKNADFDTLLKIAPPLQSGPVVPLGSPRLKRPSIKSVTFSDSHDGSRSVSQQGEFKSPVAGAESRGQTLVLSAVSIQEEVEVPVEAAVTITGWKPKIDDSVVAVHLSPSGAAAPDDARPEAPVIHEEMDVSRGFQC